MWCHPGDHWYCADGQSQFIVSSDKKQIWLTKRHENMQLRAKILGTNFKKNTSVFYHQIQKKSPPPNNVHNVFRADYLSHLFSRHLRKNWRNWRELCKVWSRPWMANDFLPPKPLIPWSSCGPQGTTLYRSQKKVQKRVGGEVVW